MKPWKLITIPVSHYCEKARWALERSRLPFDEHGHLALVSRLAGLQHGVWSSTPILVGEGNVITESSHILHFLNERVPTLDLYATPEAAELEAYFDQKLGPHTRRLTYAHIFEDARLADAVMLSEISGWQQRLKPMLGRLRTVMKRRMNIDPQAAERSLRKVEAIFSEVNSRLADDRPYLCGDRFSAADLTFVALSGPVLWLPHYEQRVSLKLAPPTLRTLVERFRAMPAGRFALALYAKERQRAV